jgi:hypothetical protein
MGHEVVSPASQHNHRQEDSYAMKVKILRISRADSKIAGAEGAHDKANSCIVYKVYNK